MEIEIAKEESLVPETGGEFGSESLQYAVGHLEELLRCYVVPFQKKILKIIADNFPAKEAQYAEEIRRQAADDELLDVTSSWPVEKLESLLITLKEGPKNE